MEGRLKPQSDPLAARDQGLRRISQLTCLLGFAAIALIGALAGYVAQAKPGRSTTPTRQVVATPPPTISPEEEVGSSVAPPSEPPLSATESPQVVTGGS